METVIDRKRVKLRRSGGSRAVTVPKEWLHRVGVDDDISEIEMILGKTSITLAPAQLDDDVDSIEAEPMFAAFLDFLVQSAAEHPETLRNAVDVFAEDEDLLPVSMRSTSA
jgi:antitoxin component of MazEF toxin-antitoxin module